MDFYTEGKRPPTYFNMFRFIQFVSCIACFLLIVFTLPGLTYFPVQLLLFAATVLFLFITLVDILSYLFGTPMHWRTWLLVAIPAIIIFPACAALLFMQGFSSLIIVTFIILILTGIFFLIELLNIGMLVYKKYKGPKKLFSLLKPKKKVQPQDSSIQVDDTTLDPMQDFSFGKKCKSLALQKKSGIQDCNPPCKDLKSRERMTRKSAEPCGGQPLYKGRTKAKGPLTKPTTHGGTFAMCKNLVPLPSPPPKEKCQRESMLQRTVSVSTRTVPKSESCTSDILRTPRTSTSCTPKEHHVCQCGKLYCPKNTCKEIEVDNSSIECTCLPDTSMHLDLIPEIHEKSSDCFCSDEIDPRTSYCNNTNQDT